MGVPHRLEKGPSASEDAGPQRGVDLVVVSHRLEKGPDLVVVSYRLEKGTSANEDTEP